MKSSFRALGAGAAVVCLLAGAPAAGAAPTPEVELGAPLAQAHAHNDYEHDRPLLDALEHGFTSVEADVWLVDGRASDLGSGLAPEFMPLVSQNWNTLFTWQGVGEMPAEERERLQDYVDQAHAEGYRVRFWATNDIAGSARENLWTELQAAGVDHINTDDLAGLQEFLSH